VVTEKPPSHAADIYTGGPQASEGSDADLPPPTGTMFVMLVYIGLLCAMWGAAYWLLVTR
jgi:hypothetical protein